MDDRVERHNRPELSVAGRQCEEVALPKLDLGVFPSADGDHALRQVDAYRSNAMAGEPGRDMARAAAQVCDGHTLFALLNEASEQGSIERLMGKLVAEADRIILRDRVIASANGVVPRRSVHCGQ